MIRMAISMRCHQHKRTHYPSTFVLNFTAIFICCYLHKSCLSLQLLCNTTTIYFILYLYSYNHWKKKLGGNHCFMRCHQHKRTHYPSTFVLNFTAIFICCYLHKSCFSLQLLCNTTTIYFIVLKILFCFCVAINTWVDFSSHPCAKFQRYKNVLLLLFMTDCFSPRICI